MSKIPSDIVAVPLTAEEYREYGNVIESRSPSSGSTLANQGTAIRTNWLCDFKNLRSKAKMNVCTFRCTPPTNCERFDINLLERHQFSTQVFIPMTAANRYLVIVARGGDVPDLKTIKAFVASKNQAISYHPGTWHHPMVALDTETEFTCLVNEDGTSDDTHVLKVSSIRCHIPKSKL